MVLEECLGRNAEKLLLPIQPGDVLATFADVDDLIRDVSFQLATTIEAGIEKFVDSSDATTGSSEEATAGWIGAVPSRAL